MRETAADAASTGQDPLVGSVLAERYRVEELLGRGGMGAVYRARHVHMRKTFAIKVLHKEMTAVEEVVKRFEREAVAAARIEHANVAAATDFGQLEDGSFYLVLEFVPGNSLRQQLRHEGPLPVDRALFIARQIAAALAAAHAHDIVHRDLKPDNVMLIEKGGVGDFVKVLDFGIAKVAPDVHSSDAPLTRFGTVFGTPQYMAPEQAAGQVVDGRADLYALGLMLHEMLTGKPAFDSEELVVLITLQMTEPPPPLPAHVPREVSGFVEQLLEKQPDNRPESAELVVQRLDALIEKYAPALASAVRPVLPSSIGGAPPSSQTRSLTEASRWLESVSGLARSVTTRYVAPSARTLIEFGRRRSIKRIPNWVFLLAIVGVVALLVGRGSDEQPGAIAPENKPKAEATGENKGLLDFDDDEEEDSDKSPTPSEEAALDPQVLQVMREARRGSKSALYALELREEGKRTKLEWLAIAQGRLKQRQLSEALKAYEKALKLEPRYANDRYMLSGLRYFATKDSNYDQVLQFAAEHMGAPGADLIFHVWSTTSQVTPFTQKAKDLLYANEVREHMSEALRVAMDLRRALTCEDFKKLLPAAEKHADRRALLPLKDLTKTEGCGGDKREDCFPCLRDSPLLKDAVQQVQMRAAPTFRRGRWR